MLRKFFAKSKPRTNVVSSLDKLNETLEMLEKKEKLLLKKSVVEIEKAKKHSKDKNKKAAIQCLKRKKLYEQQIEQLGNFQLRLHDHMIMLEGAKATTDTVDALSTGALTMKAMNKSIKINDVDKTLDDIDEQTERLKQIQDAISLPIGVINDLDEDELEAELEELEEADLEEQLPQISRTVPEVRAPIVSSSIQHVHPTIQRSTREDDELAALQAEMAM